MADETRAISWVKPALNEFRKFPSAAQAVILDALTIAAAGRKADIAKPMKGVGGGVFEIALAHRGDAYRAVYAIKLGPDLWVVHAFKKKSTKGISTPKKEIDLIRRRIRLLKEAME